ncbi:BTB-POZ domain-containing protein [Megavirus chiliensis]|uniref:BTB POZ domain-containing n=2 Tax=Megamimivirinae TaxID=3044648 RepID=A0A2L2DLK7_MIMIV|nr:putative BTB/POZ domain-containing protein [Megavirus chiliensis]AEQ33443.1 BTB-POZ domain-containing protein [Megavirus chiliensis]AVG47046.1 BTB POZ domain-containing [Acanthamoeba polyphaga mimivirus]
MASSIITIITYNGRTQTNLDTINKCDKLVSMINNNTIHLDIDIKNAKKILNYLRGYNINHSIKYIAYDAKKLGIDLGLSNHIYINIGGEIYHLEKNLLVAKLEYFEKFFEYNHSLEPDYSSIVIDRCPDIFDHVLQYIQQEKSLYFKKGPNINSSVVQELDFYMKKPVQVLPAVFDLSGFYYYEKNFNYFFREKILPFADNNDCIIFIMSPKKYYPKILFELDTLDNINENDLYSQIHTNNNYTYDLFYDKISKLIYINLSAKGFDLYQIQIGINKSICIKNNCLYSYHNIQELESYNATTNKYFYKDIYFKKQFTMDYLTPKNIFEINIDDVLKYENIRKNLITDDIFRGRYPILDFKDLDNLLSNNVYKLDIKIVTKINDTINFIEIKHDNKIIYRSDVTAYWINDFNHSTIKHVENKNLDLNFFLSQKNRNDKIIIFFNDAMCDEIKIYIKFDMINMK